MKEQSDEVAESSTGSGTCTYVQTPRSESHTTFIVQQHNSTQGQHSLQQHCYKQHKETLRMTQPSPRRR